MRRITFVLALVALAAPALLQAQQFGAYSAYHNGEIFLSEPVNQSDPATIYIYRQTGSGWTETGTLMAPAHEGGDYFGRFVAVDDQSLIVGSTLYEGSTGAIWIYRRNGAEWEFSEMMRPEDVADGDSFGRFGLLHGDLLFVSALGHNESRGAVWVFQRGADGAWVQEAKLEPGADAPNQEFFGWSLAYDGERLITGALQASPDLQNRGAAYIFRRDAPGDWTQEARLSLPEDDSEPGDSFGFVVGWLNGKALIGTPGRDNGIGEVRTYQLDGEAWTPGVTLSAYDRSQGSRFGSSLAVGEGELWVGATGAQSAGRVYRIEYDAYSDEFGNASKLAGLDPDVGDNFGGTITLAGGTAIVGATGDDFGLGSAVILERTGASWAGSAKLYGPDPAGLDPLVAGEITCTEGQADQFSCKQVDIASFLPVRDIGGGRGANVNDVWGWTDPESGREYAIVGRTDGTAFIDVTDAASPTYLGNLPKTEGSRGNSWRDIKVYDNHAFIVADGAGQHGMQVFDLTRLRDVPNAPATFDEDAHYGGIASAHNIVVNEETGFAYAVGVNSGGETCGGGLAHDQRAATDPSGVRGVFLGYHVRQFRHRVFARRPVHHLRWARHRVCRQGDLFRLQ